MLKLKSDILFTGYYGQKNMGDDAFVEVAAWGAKKYWGKESNRFLSITKNLPVTKNPVKGYPITLPRSYKIQNKLLIPATEYLVSAGGSTLCSEIQAYDAKSIALKRKKKYNDIKIGAIGVSIGPFNSISDEKSITKYLKELNFLSVRDQASFDIVKQLNLPYQPINSFDLAALLPNIYGINKKSDGTNKRVVGISLCPYESIVNKSMIRKEDNRNNRTIELIKKLNTKDDIHFKFFIINGNSKVGDLKITLDVIRRLRLDNYEVIDYNPVTEIMWNEISSCDFMICTRLHAAIFACFSDTPFMLNEYHRKCSDFLDNIAYDNSLRVFDSDYDFEEKSDYIIRVLNNANEYSPPKKVEDMKVRAELNFTAVRF